MREIGRLVLVLGLIGSFSALALSYVRETLQPRIERQSDFYVRGPALERLFDTPASQLLRNKIIVDVDGLSYPIFYSKRGDELAGLAVEASGQGGYGGDVVIMIGIDLKNSKVLGVEIVSHSETPGLGARIEKKAFRRQWKKLVLGASVALRASGGQVDAITGATFSSKAMIHGTNQVLDLIKNHEEDIRNQIALVDNRTNVE
jgi:Na+-translocating ferredoxin:NAD+ oxidoreductase subunit G